MDEMIKKILNEFAKNRSEFSKLVIGKQRELFKHIAKIILYAKYDKQNFNHWCQEIFNYLQVTEQRPKFKPNNVFPNSGFFYKIHVIEPFMESDDKTIDYSQSYYILRGVKLEYIDKITDIDPEKLTSEDKKKIMTQIVSFLEECCKYLGEWTLTPQIVEDLIKDKFKDYIN